MTSMLSVKSETKLMLWIFATHFIAIALEYQQIDFVVVCYFRY